MRNSRNKNNQRTNRKQRHRNHAVLLKRTALNSHAVASLILPAKSYSPPSRKKGSGVSESNLWKPKAVSKSGSPALITDTSNNMNEKEKTIDTGGKAGLSGPTNRWYNNPRITGAVAAVLLFATLAIAIIPTATNVRAEEQAEVAVIDPVRQLAKEYIYAGSRMLAIEDYGVTPAATPTPTVTPTLTPTPTPTPTTNNSSPTGHFDVIDGNLVVGGWSFDPDDPNNSNDVHIYIGGPAGVGTAYAVTANVSRPDVNAAFSIGGNHGFSFQIPAQHNTGQWTAVYVYGIDRGTNSPTLLDGSPQYFGTPPTPTPTSTPTATPTPTPDPVTGCQYGFTSLGGVISSDPAAAVFDGKVYAFARGTDGAVYFQYSSGSSFSGWNYLGGIITSNPASMTDGTTLYVEGLGTDSNRYYKSTTDGYNFSEWQAGTVTTQTTASASFNSSTYTFVKGTGSTPHLCVKVE